MPDQYGFDHLGSERACIEEGCGERGPSHVWTERERQRHHERHENQRKHRLEQQRKQNLRLARRAKAMADRENAVAYREEDA